MSQKPRTIESQMTPYPWATTRATSLAEAATIMRRAEFRHLPVIEEGKVVGIISDRDLRQAELIADSMDLLVGDVMTADPW